MTEFTLDRYAEMAAKWRGSPMLAHLARPFQLFAETERCNRGIRLGDDLVSPEGGILRVFAIDYGCVGDVAMVEGSYHDRPGIRERVSLADVERDWRRRI